MHVKKVKHVEFYNIFNMIFRLKYFILKDDFNILMKY